MITISKEDYLKAIAEAEAEGHDVIPATLSHWLSVTRPAVSFAIKRLSRDGFAAMTTDGHIRLTAKGRDVAQRTLIRHQLIERMLSEIFGMPWYEIHDEAERLEHAVSPAFEKKLIEKLGHKDSCPHGNGFTFQSPAERRKRGMCRLSEGNAKKKIHRRERLRTRSQSAGVFRQGRNPSGAHVAIDTKNYDGTISALVGKRPIRLGTPAAERCGLPNR